MNFNTGVLLVTCLLFSLSACKSDTKAEAAKKEKENIVGVYLDENVKDVGAIPRDVPVTTNFIITNSKPDTIRLMNPTTTCDCMKLTLSKKVLAPKDTALLTTIFNARIPGLFSKEIYLNYPGQDSALVATVKGHVKQ